MLIHFYFDYCCCFSWGGNLDFLDFLQKNYNIDYWTILVFSRFELRSFNGAGNLLIRVEDLLTLVGKRSIDYSR